MTMKKGISLIVLIITIIVMIIIAGAIIMSLSNTNIIDLAGNAVDEHNIAVEKEKIMLAIQEYHLQKATSANPKTLEQVLREQLADDAKTITAMGDGSISIVMKKTENRYIVSPAGDVTGPYKPVGTALERYILGENGTGRDLMEIVDMSADIPAFINPELDVSFLTMMEGEQIDENTYTILAYIKYNGNEYYKARVLIQATEDSETYTTDGTYGVQFIAKIEEDSLVGQYLRYDGMLWRVLYDDEINGLQVICDEAITDKQGNKIKLGYNDPTIDTSKIEHFEDFNTITDTTNRENLEKALYSYNNAIVTLNNAAKNAVTAAPGIIKDVRSVGSVPNNKNSGATTKYNSQELLAWGTPTLNGKGFEADTNYVQDNERMILIGNANTTNNEYYWLASRKVFFWENKSSYIDTFTYGMYIMRYDEYMSGLYEAKLISASIQYNYSAYGSYDQYCIRPVITLEEGVMEKLNGEGTSGKPYDLDKYVEDHLVTNAEADVIPNGTYYMFGEASDTYVEITNTGNVFYLSGTACPATITINKGSVTMNVTVGTNTLTFDGNYYETISNNKILTLGMGDFGTSGNSKNARTGFLFALNTNDLKYDIEGAYLGDKTNTITFTKGSNLAKYTYAGQSTPKTYKYVGFKDMFYINDRQIKYSGLEDGFGWDDANGPYNKQ